MALVVMRFANSVNISSIALGVFFPWQVEAESADRHPGNPSSSEIALPHQLL
jgi:hypothetical protein